MNGVSLSFCCEGRAARAWPRRLARSAIAVAAKAARLKPGCATTTSAMAMRSRQMLSIIGWPGMAQESTSAIPPSAKIRSVACSTTSTPGENFAKAGSIGDLAKPGLTAIDDGVERGDGPAIEFKVPEAEPSVPGKRRAGVPQRSRGLCVGLERRAAPALPAGRFDIEEARDPGQGVFARRQAAGHEMPRLGEARLEPAVFLAALALEVPLEPRIEAAGDLKACAVPALDLGDLACRRQGLPRGAIARNGLDQDGCPHVAEKGRERRDGEVGVQMRRTEGGDGRGPVAEQRQRQAAADHRHGQAEAIAVLDQGEVTPKVPQAGQNQFRVVRTAGRQAAGGEVPGRGFGAQTSGNEAALHQCPVWHKHGTARARPVPATKKPASRPAFQINRLSARSGVGLDGQNLTALVNAGLQVDVVRAAKLTRLLVLDPGHGAELVAGPAHADAALGHFLAWNGHCRTPCDCGAGTAAPLKLGRLIPALSAQGKRDRGPFPPSAPGSCWRWTGPPWRAFQRCA